MTHRAGWDGFVLFSLAHMVNLCQVAGLRSKLGCAWSWGCLSNHVKLRKDS